MKYLSVCSGIEAASVAWHPLGWEPLAFSEIEAFPRAVLAHHYPDVPLHGDFTVLRDQPWIVDADVLVGGTPCQAFSVAGLRNSLADERGNLSMEFVRLADAIDDLRIAGGRDQSVIVWENVPGVLSVKDNAFGCFLAALAGDVAPYVPPRGKWTNAGVVAGPARQVAWRVLDAQYFGLAQRRRRVFVVASARDGFDPAAVLLEFEGLRRDTPPRREAGQGVAGTIEASLGRSRGAGTPPGALSHWDGDGHPHPTLNQSAKGSGGVGASNQELFSQRGAYLVEGKQWPADIAPTLNAHFGEKQGLEDQHALGGAGLFVPATVGALTAKYANAFGAPEVDAGLCLPVTLRAEGYDASEDGTGRGTPLVPVQAFYSNESRCNNIPPPGISPPLKVGSGGTSGNPPAVAYQPIGFSYKDSGNDAAADLSPTLRSLGAYDANGGGNMGVAYPINTQIALRHNALGERTGMGIGDTEDPAFTLQAGHSHAVAYAFQPRIARNGRGDMGDVVNALNAQSGETGKGDAAPCVAIPLAVRRLTVVECSRLQGFPDDYLLRVIFRGKCPPADGVMYKALGNSMAVPCMRWIGRRIAEALRHA